MRGPFARLLAMAVLIAACAPATESPAPSAAAKASASATRVAASTATVGPTAAVSVTSTTTAAPTATPTPTPAPITTGRWVVAGRTAIGRRMPQVTRLGGGSVMVLGNESEHCVREDSVRTEIWQPGSGDWSAGPELSKPRAGAALATVGGRRALVTGGVNAGSLDREGQQTRHQAFSSTFIFDPDAAAEGWSRAGLLGTARADATAATLHDGRVLVAGGFYIDGTEHSGGDAPIVLAAARSRFRGASPGDIRLTDVDVPQVVPALATAEVYDPATDAWSATGPMRYARFGAAAVTLADGRVLIVGSRVTEDLPTWNDIDVRIDERAHETYEIYDPSTGTFSLGQLPRPDWSSISDLGSPVDEGRTSLGTLVALADGGALLVGEGLDWFAYSGDDYVQAVRTMRFDPSSGAWRSIDLAVFVYGPQRPKVERLAGRSREAVAAATLADGHVLVAGGIDFMAGKAAQAAELYDPVSDAWSSLPPMPARRAGGTAIVLKDGSALVVGGRAIAGDKTVACDDPSSGLRASVRFVPGP